MNVVIQCAASKHGNFFRAKDEREIIFVADPTLAPLEHGYVYARPDDPTDDGVTWREKLIAYNERPGNLMRLAPAFELYGNPVYRRLVEKFGVEKVFILSAGWGLINAAFLTPCYDITFSQSVRQKGERYKFRGKGAVWNDLCQLPNSDEPVVFLGGKDYVPLFCQLTRAHRGRRIIFYNSDNPPVAPDCDLYRFRTATRTNWHYECARVFLDQKISVDDVEQPGLGYRAVNNGMTSEGGSPRGASASAVCLRPASEAFEEKEVARLIAARSGQCRTVNAPKADDFRKALGALFDDAEKEGWPHIEIKAGDLHRLVGGYPGTNHRMPQCCDAMRTKLTSQDVIVSAPPSGRGASLAIRYRLPRTT